MRIRYSTDCSECASVDAALATLDPRLSDDERAANSGYLAPGSPMGEAVELARAERIQKIARELADPIRLKELRDVTEAWSRLLKHREHSQFAVNAWVRAKLWLEWGLGRWLVMNSPGSGRPRKNLHDVSFLQQIGIGSIQSHRWQRLWHAAPTEEAFLLLLGSAAQEEDELTSRAVYGAIAAEPTPAKQPAPPLPPGQFDLLYVDPPWKYEFMAVDAWAVENHYPTMAFAELAALSGEIRKLTAANSLIFLWAPAPKLEWAMDLLPEWGFVYKTCMVWVKHENKAGMGYYGRVGHELLLIGTRGQPGVPPPERRPPSVLRASKGKHSEKPDEMRALIEMMYPDTRRIELFARGCAPEGWTYWGNEAR